MATPLRKNRKASTTTLRSAVWTSLDDKEWSKTPSNKSRDRKSIWECVVEGTRHVLEVRVHIDASYYFQSSATLRRYNGEKWHTVASLPWTEIKTYLQNDATGSTKACERELLRQFCLLEGLE